MLEFLLLTSCYFSNYQACYQASSAYYTQSGIEQNVNNYSQKIERKLDNKAKFLLSAGYMVANNKMDTSAAINDNSKVTMLISTDTFKLGYIYEF